MRPFQAVTDLVSEMNRMRQLGRTGYAPGYEPREGAQAAPWVPAADIFSRGADVVIRVELPGVRAEDVDITLASGVLTVSGEPGDDLGDQDVDFYVRERPSGAFRRSMSVPVGIDEGDISADIENGLVEIVVRGAATAAAPRRIALKDRSVGP
jgi:HSP20 family protein